MADIDELLEEIQATIREAHESNVVWRAITLSPAPRGRNAAVNFAPDFFNAVARSAATNVYITLSRLYESGLNTRGLSALISEARKKKFISAEVAKRASVARKRGLKLWEKAEPIRHRVVAHSDARHRPEDVFVRAGITPNDLSRAIEGAVESLNEVLEGVDMALLILDDGVINQVSRIFRKLSR